MSIFFLFCKNLRGPKYVWLLLSNGTNIKDVIMNEEGNLNFAELSWAELALFSLSPPNRQS